VLELLGKVTLAVMPIEIVMVALAVVVGRVQLALFLILLTQQKVLVVMVVQALVLLLRGKEFFTLAVVVVVSM
jgi:hypothetical protein